MRNTSLEIGVSTIGKENVRVISKLLFWNTLPLKKVNREREREWKINKKKKKNNNKNKKKMKYKEESTERSSFRCVVVQRLLSSPIDLRANSRKTLSNFFITFFVLTLFYGVLMNFQCVYILFFFSFFSLFFFYTCKSRAVALGR